MTATAPVDAPAYETLEARALPAAPEPRRRNSVMVATLFAIAGGTMLLGGLLAGYFEARDAVEGAGEAWPPDGIDLPNAALLVTYVTLVLSSFTVQWAVAAIKMEARRQMYVALGTTLLLGVAFINAMTFVWSQLELVAGESLYADLVLAVTVGHVLLVAGALVLLVVMGFRALGGQFSARSTEFVSAAAAFWHFVVVAGVVVWLALWFLEGGPHT